MMINYVTLILKKELTMINASKDAENLVGCIELSLVNEDRAMAEFDVQKALEHAYEQGRKSARKESKE